MKKAISIGSLMAKWQSIPYIIHQHPYYIALINNNKELYKKVINMSHRQRMKPTANWEHLMALKHSIHIHGYNKSADPIILKNIDGKWCCIHGRHRICILLALYGAKMKLICKIEDNKAIVKSIYNDDEKINEQKINENKNNNMQIKENNIIIVHKCSKYQGICSKHHGKCSKHSGKCSKHFGKCSKHSGKCFKHS